MKTNRHITDERGMRVKEGGNYDQSHNQQLVIGFWHQSNNLLQPISQSFRGQGMSDMYPDPTLNL